MGQETAAVENATVRLLLVDDDAQILSAFTRLFSGMGYSVFKATNGSEATALLGADHYDVIISDIAMPKMDGMEFLRKVRQHDLDVPVILVTGDPSIDTAVHALEYGAFRYLIKPVDTRILMECVRNAVRMHKMAKLKRQALDIIGTGDSMALGDRAALEERFAQALMSLWMAFQPVISMKKRTIFGYEALVRTDEPTLASPSDLLSAAERLKRLHELGRVIRARVAAAILHAPSDVKILMNLHSLDLNDDQLYNTAAPLSEVASRVVLEITERASLDEVRDARGRIAALRRMGFMIAVDDLGAGYAGLSSFTQLEPEIVKLDMSLVRGIVDQPRKQSVILSMTKLSEELGMLVVTEGVETRQESEVLFSLGCDLVQGYLFAKPAKGFPTPVW